MEVVRQRSRTVARACHRKMALGRTSSTEVVLEQETSRTERGMRYLSPESKRIQTSESSKRQRRKTVGLETGNAREIARSLHRFANVEGETKPHERRYSVEQAWDQRVPDSDRPITSHALKRECRRLAGGNLRSASSGPPDVLVNRWCLWRGETARLPSRRSQASFHGRAELER